MKLTWHIISNDIVRDRWALLLWALLFVGQTGSGVFARNYAGIDDAVIVYLQPVCALLVFLQLVMSYVLVARLVQADALVGTSMFWRTRPVSAGRLLVAKMLGALLLFALLPILLMLPWWLYCQFGWRDILWTAIEMAGWQLLIIAPAFLVASITDDLGRVLLWTLLLVIGVFSWIVLLQSSLVLGRSFGQPEAAVMYTRLWVCGLMLVLGSMAIAVHQYLTRHFVRSVALVVACLGLIALTGQVWPWNWSRSLASLHQPALAPIDRGLLDRLSFAVEPATGRFGGLAKTNRNADDKDAWLNLKLRVRGLPDDLAIGTESVSQTWSWDNGLKLTRAGAYYTAYWGWSDSPGDVAVRRAYALPMPVEDPETLRWLQVRRERINARVNANRVARGLPPVAMSSPPSREPKDAGVLLWGNARVPNSFLAKMKAEAPTYRADAQWELYRPEVVVELPLKTDARASARSLTFHLGQFNEGRPLMISTRPAVTEHGAWFSVAASSGFREWVSRERFVAVNRVTGDITGVRDGQSGSKRLYVGGVIVDWNVFGVYPRTVLRNDVDVAQDPQWRDHTILVLLVDKAVARFDRGVETLKFELKPDPADNAHHASGP